jgi:hypothetical protein
MVYSISPEGEKFKLPEEQDYKKEYGKLQKLVKKHKAEGREVVVVMGLGFVGAVMAGVVADSVGQEDRQAQQARHRHATAEPPELLENPPFQPGRFSCEGRRPGSGASDRTVREPKEIPGCNLHL